MSIVNVWRHPVYRPFLILQAGTHLGVCDGRNSVCYGMCLRPAMEIMMCVIVVRLQAEALLLKPLRLGHTHTHTQEDAHLSQMLIRIVSQIWLLKHWCVGGDALNALRCKRPCAHQ